MIRIFQISVLAALVLAGNAFAADAPPNYTPEEIRQLCFKLSSNDDAVRWKAARELKQAGTQATDMLCTILQGEWLEGRKLAAYVLGQIKDPSAILPLASCLGDDEFHVRWKCAVSLVAIGEQAVPQLVRVLRTGNLNAKYCAAWALGEIKDPRGVLALAETATAEDEDLRWKSVISLKRIGPAAVQELNRLLNADSVRARSCAVWALDQLGGQNVVEPLLSAADDPAEEVRRRVAEALVQFDRPEVRRALEKLVTDNSPDVRRQAVRSLTRLGKEAADAEFEDEATPLWAPKELIFTPEEPAENAEMQVTLLAPSQKKSVVYGYEENGAWHARFAPDETGEWFYTIRFSAGEQAAVEHGMFTCRDSQLAPALSIKAEPRPHLTAGEQPIFLLEAPPAGYLLTIEPWKLLLEKCGERGFNLVRLDLPALFDACRQAGKTEQQRWNLLDGVLSIAHRSGVYVLVTLFNENEIRSDASWERSPCNSRNGGPVPADQRFPLFYDPISRQIGQMQNDYLRETLLRTQCHANVVYELCRGFNTDGSAIPYARGWLIQRLKNFENTPRPVVLSAAEANERLFRTDGIDIAGLQADAPDAEKIALPRLVLQNAPDDAAQTVVAGWHAFFGGAAGASWNSTRAADFEEAVGLVDAAEDRAGVLADFAGRSNLQEMKANDSFLLSVPPQLQASAMMGDGRMLLFVSGSAEGGEVLRIGMPAGTYAAEWTDTRSGRKVAADTVEQKNGAIEVACPRFTEGAVCEIRAE